MNPIFCVKSSGAYRESSVVRRADLSEALLVDCERVVNNLQIDSP